MSDLDGATERDRMARVINGGQVGTDEPVGWEDLADADALLAAGFGDTAALTAERDALAARVAAVEALAEKWRYKGEFGWGAWQEGHGPDQEGCVLDQAATDLRTALASQSTPVAEGEGQR